MAVQISKRDGRKHYYAWIEGRYVSTGHTDQRLAMQAASQMESVGVEAYRQGKRNLSESLPDLIEEYLEYLRDEDHRKPEHLRKKRVHLMAAVNAGAVRKLRDVRKQTIEPWLKSLTCGSKTRNEYLNAWNVFLKWLVYEGRLNENPIRNRIRRAVVQKHETTKRRPLTFDEIEKLLSVSGERALLYQTAASTGARLGELQQLRWDCVHEDATPPTIELRPETTKNGNGRAKAIPIELVDALRDARPSATSMMVFPTRPSHHTIDRDLERAGIPKRTEEGVASFHSLRHTYTTWGAAESKDVRVAQRLADHSDIKTTQRYLHTSLEEEAELIARFPSLRATRRATDVVQTSQNESNDVLSSPTPERTQPESSETLSLTESNKVVRCREMEPGGIEPPCRDSQNPASTRVVRCLISISRTGTDTLPIDPAPGEPPRQHARLPRVLTSPMSLSPAPSGVRRRTDGC